LPLNSVCRESFKDATQYQVASRLDEITYNVLETLALTMDYDMEINSKPLSSFKEIPVEA